MRYLFPFFTLFFYTLYPMNGYTQNCPAGDCSPASCERQERPNCCPPKCFDRGYPTKPACTLGAYNEPANFEPCKHPWGFWFDLSFTYWRADQEGMDLAVSSTELGTILLAPQNGRFLFQEVDFKPGFQAGLGINLGHDHWNALFEYTMFRSKTTVNKNAPGDARGGIPLWIFSNWFDRQTNTAAANIVSKWHLNIDILDGALTRPYYQGTHLIVSPFGGLRAEWIRQRLRIAADIFTSSTSNPPLDAISQNLSKSWGLGPRVGCDAKWHLGAGFRLEGDVAASLLFTRYLKIATTQTATSTASTAGAVSARTHHYDTIRSGLELNAGIGWGHYFGCQSCYHFDFLATYDFKAFFNQNMMRQLVDTLADGSGMSPCNLYLQGLTVRAELDF